VVTTKSVEYMPFLLSFFSFLNGGIWTFYAVLVKDFFVGVSYHYYQFFTTIIGIISYYMI